MTDNTTRQEFFKALFGGTKGIYEVRLFGANGSRPEQIFFDNLDQLNTYAIPEDRNVCFGCAPRATRGGKKENVGMVTTLWCDLDYGEDGHKQKPVYMTEDKALAAIHDKLPFHPSIINNSGGGLHLYWLLSEPVPVDTPESREHVENVMRGLENELGADSTHDVCRVFRMPGSFNLKIPGQPRPCRTIHFDANLRYNILDFNTLQKSTSQQPINKPANQRKFNFEGLPGWCKTIIMSGDASGYSNDRSKRDYAVIKSLMLHCATDDEIKEVFDKYAVGDKVRGEKNGRTYLQHTITKLRSIMEPSPQAQPEKNKGINPGAEAARILADLKLKYVCGDSFYMYEAGYWRRINETHLLSIIDRYLGEKAKRAHRSEVLEKLRVHCDVQLLPGHDMNTNRDLINLNTGMFNISTGMLLPHSPDHLSTLRIQTPFVEGDTCPGFLKFLSEVLPDENQRAVLQEFFGYSLTMDCKYEKAAILYGESGCNGKSVTLNLLETMLGVDNCTHEPWDLLAEPFHIIRLRGRLLNVSAETPPNEATDTSLFKQLVSGDSVSDSHKHRDRIDFHPFAKLAFACNTLPRIYDSSEAFFRRVLLFHFPISFQGREDRTLTDRLKQEMPGILNWAIKGLLRLRSNNQFTQSSASAEKLEQFRRQNNPVRTFVMEKCVIGDTLEVEKKTLFDAYKEFCEESGFKALNKVHFFRELRRCADVENNKNIINGKSVPSIIGLCISWGDDNETD